MACTQQQTAAQQPPSALLRWRHIDSASRHPKWQRVTWKGRDPWYTKGYLSRNGSRLPFARYKRAVWHPLVQPIRLAKQLWGHSGLNEQSGLRGQFQQRWYQSPSAWSHHKHFGFLTPGRSLNQAGETVANVATERATLSDSHVALNFL